MTMSRNERLAKVLDDRGLKLSLAESCTGGLIGSILTSMSGSSSFFMGSAVTYSNESKERLLGVSHDSLVRYGAVSKAVAEQMAEGSLRAYGSDIAGSVTGIAGPGGGTSEKPVGTVWMAVTDGKVTEAFENHFDGTRDEIRQRTAEVLMEHLIELAERE